MLNRRLLIKIMYLPVKRASRVLTNILIFDMVMSIYRYAKVRFLFGRPEQEKKEDDVLNEDLLSRLKKRG